MTQSGGGDTINRGPSPARDERAPAAAGNVRDKGDDPDPPAPVDLDTTRERAS